MAAMRSRMRREIEMLENDPPHGICAWPKGDRLDELEAQIQGPEGTPYEKGVFLLQITIPERYPFEPPKVHFVTPIYHPNIDNAGRICLDTLKMQPKGSWMPSVNLSTLLTTIRLLMAEPNPDDGLMPEITDLYKQNHDLFVSRATAMTAQHAQTNAMRAPQAASKAQDESKEEDSDDDNESQKSSQSSASSDNEVEQSDLDDQDDDGDDTSLPKRPRYE
ncbi:Ubiquitin-conjugating enzyme E2 T [Aphanomyces cochlioides]|nr:Ubiquitin-conjugating enzyme E2 T [Aphanomyces cochlioides]